MSFNLRSTNWMRHGKTFVTPVRDTYPFIAASNAGSMCGRSVLITGASRGIGRSAAVHFAKAGCTKIALAARSSLVETEAAVIKAATDAQTVPQIVSLDIDVTSISSVQAAADEVKSVFGHLDILINNAGYHPHYQYIADSDPLEYWKTWNTNVNGAYLCVRYFLPLLLGSQLKTVINVTSVGGQLVLPGALSYMTSKFALCRFTEFLDVEYAQQGLITCALNPGAVKTEMALSLPQELHELLTDTAELAADTMIWLSKEGREWLGGRFINATWNMEKLEGRKDELMEKGMLKFRMSF